jgi:hypothetical protein
VMKQRAEIRRMIGSHIVVAEGFAMGKHRARSLTSRYRNAKWEAQGAKHRNLVFVLVPSVIMLCPRTNAPHLSWHKPNLRRYNRKQGLILQKTKSHCRGTTKYRFLLLDKVFYP